MIGNKFYTWFKNYYQWVGGAFNETLLLPLVRATSGLRAGAIRYDEVTDTVETYDGENWNAIPSASGFVPYTGATTDVDLGNEGISAGYVKLDVTPTGTPTDQGTIYWDDSTETAALIMNGTTQHIGQDVFYYVKNSTGSPIPKGTAVRFAGTDGNSGHLLIAPFIANGSVPSTYFMGVTSEAIANGGFGKVMHFGELDGINTNAYTDGAILYASTTVAGGFQTTVPTAPNNIVQIAAVINAANNGSLLVRPTLASNINTDEAVRIISPIAGQGLFYDNGLWVNKSIATVLGYTPVPPTRMITINGTAQDLSADRTYNVGTVTSVGLTSATSGVSVSGSPVTVSGDISLSIATASGSQNGLLSSTDWSTFNAKQAALTLTTTGNSGASTLVGATLNVPEYTLSGLSGVPTSRTLSINGTSYDLTANRTWSVGTVTSVGLTTSTTGVTIGSTPVTGSGNITIDIATASGSAIGLLSSSDWTTFNNKQNAITLTTSGSSGAATLIGSTLNVPQYQAAGNYITALTGEVTASGPGSASATLTNSAVIGKVLTGLNLTGGGTIAATDSILEAFGKVQNQISAMVGGVMFQGTWNASTNTPTLASGTGTKGHYYIVDVSGTTTLDGKSDWRVGDWAIYNGTAWDKVDNTDAVSSVNGFTGAVSLSTSHINEGTNLYYTDARARAAITLTTTGNSGSATYDASGVLNVPTYTLAGLGGVASTRTLTINGTAFDLSSDRSWSVGTVTSVGLSSSTSGVTIGSTPVTGSGTITLAIATASGSQNGLLSSTDWTTFNNKQNALTNPVTGTGTSGQVAYFNGTSTITSESNLFWDASNDRLGIGETSPQSIIHAKGASSGAVSMYLQNTNGGTNSSAELVFGVTSSASVSTPSAKIVALNTFISNAATALTFHTYNTSGVSGERMHLSPNGNLGLGVTPSAWGSAAKAMQLNTATAISGIGGDAHVSNGMFFDGTNWKYLVSGVGVGTYYQTIGQHIWLTAGSGTIGNNVSLTQAMTLDASGRLGIGTSTPSVKLHVQDTSSTNPSLLILEGFNTGRGLEIKLGTDGLGGDGSAVIYNTRISAPYGEHIWQQAGVQRMRLDSSGNLGLGVTPSAWLSTVKAIQFGGAGSVFSIGSTNNTFLSSNEFINASGDNIYINSTFATRYQQFEGSHRWLTAPSGTAGNAISFTQAMTLDANGRLGIGTPSPQNRLHVSFQNDFDGLRIENSNRGHNYLLTTAGSSAEFFSIYDVDNSQFLYQVSNDNGHGFLTGGVARMAITSGGNVGIGTTSNVFGERLTVNNWITAGDLTRVALIGQDGTNVVMGAYSNHNLVIRTNNTTRLTIASTGAATFSSSVTTGAPSGGTAQAWKLGSVGTQALSQSRYVEVEINGTTYWLLATDVQV